MEILVIGAGYVGLVTAACFAEMGHHVICLDQDPLKITLLDQGNVPFYEPMLQELIEKNRKAKRLSFTQNYSMGLKKAEICFIAVGTPQKKDGSANLSYVEAAATSIAKHMQKKLLIVMKSTVPVGTCKEIEKLIEKVLLERKAKVSFEIASNPEFLKEGSAISDCMKPDRIIIGAHSEWAASYLKEIYASFTFNRDRIFIMDLCSAEMTKYASNAMLASRISFMNELSELCEKLGVNIKNVRLGMSTDKRIGSHFLYAGAGYGGACFPKDIRALIDLAHQNNCAAPLLEAVNNINEKQKTVLYKKISHFFRKKGGVQGKTIAIWGLTFKPETDDMREAPSLTLIELLHKQGAILRLYDPVATSKAKKILSSKKQIYFCLSEYHAAEASDAIVLMTEWKQFRFVNLQRVLSKMKGNAFFDGRNQYSAKAMAIKGFSYFGIGIPSMPVDLLQELKKMGKKKALSYANSRMDSLLSELD